MAYGLFASEAFEAQLSRLGTVDEKMVRAKLAELASDPSGTPRS